MTIDPLPSRARAAADRVANERGRSERREDLKFWVSVASVVIASLAAGLAGLSAAFSGYSLEVNRDHEVASLRPYVFAPLPKVSTINYGSAGPFLRLQFRNYGQTPALRLRFNARIKVLPAQASKYSPDDIPPPNSRPYGMVLGPRDDSYDAEIPLTESFREHGGRFRNGTEMALILITYDYRDVFGHTWPGLACFRLKFNQQLELSNMTTCGTD